MGRHLIRRLVQESASLRCLVRDPARAAALLPQVVEVVPINLLEFGKLADALPGASTVVHCAAVTADRKETFPGQYRRVNGEGTRNLVEAARWAGVKRIVLLNGLGTRPGKPGSYMRTRWEMSEAVRNSGLRWVALQPSILFGDQAPYQTAIARLVRVAPVMPVLGGHRRLQPLWVEDLVTCLARCARDAARDGRAIDLGGPEQVSFDEMVDLVMDAAGARRPKLPLPVLLARVPTAAFSVLRHPPLTFAALELFDFDNTTDIDSVSKNFGFAPRSPREHFKAHRLD
jgi:NADH dehydrogenase